MGEANLSNKLPLLAACLPLTLQRDDRPTPSKDVLSPGINGRKPLQQYYNWKRTFTYTVDNKGIQLGTNTTPWLRITMEN